MFRATIWVAITALAGASVGLSAHEPDQKMLNVSAPDGPMVEIITLGTAGGPTLRKERSEPATLLIVNGQRYLFDCGTGTVRQMLLAGQVPADVRAIFITHHHPDHNLGLAEMVGNVAMEYAWSGAKRSWSILGPVGTKEMVGAAQLHYTVPYDVFYAEHLLRDVSSQASKAAISVTDIQADGIVFRDENIEVTAAENSHYQLLADTVGTKSFSYRVKTVAGIIVITGDTGMSDAVVQLSQDADVLISESMDMIAIRKYIEAQAALGVVAPEAVEPSMAHLRAGHLDLPEVGRIATSAGVGSILLTHFGPEADKTTPDKIIAAVGATFGGPIYAAKDLNHYCLTVNSQAGKPQLKAC
jgi:ribonuclease BN (tRNA processing enzyme)